jgi:tetratricopeptide (TPR) repeat protein
MQPAATSAFWTSPLKALVTDRPDDLAAKYDLSTTRVEYGRHLYLCGDYEAARQQLEAARAVAEPLVASTEREERWVELLARTYGWQGDVARALGDGGRSVASLTEAVTLCRELSAAQPADVERRHEVLIACAKLGWVLRHEGYTDDAEDAFAEAASVGEYLTSVDPMIAAWTHDLLGVKYGLAQLYLSQDDPQRAQVNCEAAVALAQQLISREPTNPGWRADLAFSHDLRGQVFLQLGQLDRARDDFETALCIREGLLTESPDDLAALKELCASHAQLGFCWLRLLDEEQALEHLQRAHAIAEMLCAQQPSVTQRAIDSISAKVNLATGHMEFCSPENNAQAEALLQDAAAFLEDPRRAAGLSGLTGTRSSLMQAISESFAELSDCLDLEEMSEVDREAGVE